ncbi:MAG: ATP-binding cassette domain-containing protein [Rhodospirillaceae bacterium]|nr:ATP-binding cassette domain-containing protein [Rhodospirillaceae bacterium]
MDKGIFQYVLRYSKKEQLFLGIMAAASLPFYFIYLALPKQIIDDALGGKGGDKDLAFPKNYLGMELEQVPYLLTLCGLFLLLVFVNGGFKYFINVYRGAAGERMLRRLRFQLLERVLRFPLPQFRKTSQGEVVSMVTLETEPLGGFFGEALSLPSYQGGTLITLMVFMFVQDWKLGLAAIALYPVQGYLIPKLQKKVNLLGKERVLTVRRLSERIGETVSGAHEIHANDTSQYELADLSDRLGRIYAIRYAIYQKKFFIKFINNFLALLTPFFFFSIGGLLVINGDITMGALIAVLSAYKDVSAPWKMLLTYYQRLEDSKIKYQQLIQKFEIPELQDENRQKTAPEEIPTLEGKLTASNISWVEDDGLRVLDGASVSFDLPSHIALVGGPGGGKSEFSQLMARLLEPTSGRITMGEKNVADLPEAVIGRQVSYVSQEPYIFSGTIRDNLLYGLKHRPLRDAEYSEEEKSERADFMSESVNSGNSAYDIQADWIDLSQVGADSQEILTQKEIYYLSQVGLEDDIYQIGLRQTIDQNDRHELAGKILESRSVLRQRLDDAHISNFVESFDQEKFNSNASVAENILFGTPVGEEFEIEALGENEYVLDVLRQCELSDDFLKKGHRLAEIMVDLFRGLPADHEFFERFSFISSDDLPEFEIQLSRASQNGLENVSDEDKARFRALPFKLIPARHHLGLVEGDFADQLLVARKVFRENLPEGLTGAVEFFDAENFNSAGSIQDNILFGKLASERAESSEAVGELMATVIRETGLGEEIIGLGLNFEVGNAGARLSNIQRQKLAIARGMIKQPDMFVMNEGLTGLDGESQAKVLQSIRAEQEGKSLLFVPSEIEADSSFDQVFSVEGGKVVVQGAEVKTKISEEPVKEERAEGGFGDEIDVLAAVPLFAGLDRSKLKLLSFASERFTYNSSEIVFNQGEVGDKAYVIIDGDADVILDTLDGPKTLVTMTRNDLFGELALLCDAPRTATIKAASDLNVMGISKDVFFKLISEDVDMSARVTRSVADRLERTTRDLSEASTVRDVVTNLPDQRLFMDRLHLTIARNQRYEELSALLWFDVGHNYDISGTMSDDDRNRLLKAIADRVVDCMRETDIVARVEDLTFAIIVSPVAEANGADLLVQRITKSLAKPIEIGGKSYTINENWEIRVRSLTNVDDKTELSALKEDDANIQTLKGNA